MLELAARSVQILVALGGAYVVAFWFVLAVWTFRDIESRSRSVVTQVFSTLMVVLFFVPGVLLYLILRPKETLDEAFQRSLEEEYLLQDLEELPLCPGCHRYVEDDFVLCPHCHAQLREPCLTCSRLVDLRWALCPYCAAVQGGRVEVAEPAEAPAARWTAPEVRRRAVAHRKGVSGTAAPASDAVPSGVPVRIEEAERSVGSATGADGAVAAGSRSSPLTLVAGTRPVVRPFDERQARDGGSGSVDDSDLDNADRSIQVPSLAETSILPERDGVAVRRWNRSVSNGRGRNGKVDPGAVDGSAAISVGPTVSTRKPPPAGGGDGVADEGITGLVETPAKGR